MFQAPPSSLRRGGALLAALALVFIAGGHWLVLQSVAWGQMLADYSRGTTLMVAAEKTFSGKFPCSMCRHISEGKKNEERKSPALAAAKSAKEFLAAAPAALPTRRVTAFVFPSPASRHADARSTEPPCPVPIAPAC